MKYFDDIFLWSEDFFFEDILLAEEPRALHWVFEEEQEEVPLTVSDLFEFELELEQDAEFDKKCEELVEALLAM